MSEAFDWLCIIGFFCLLGAAVVRVGFVGVAFLETNRTNGIEFQERVATLNETYLDAMVKLEQQFNVYEASFQESQPHIEAENLTDFLSLSQKWNKTAILYDGFERRRIGLLGVLIDFSGHFWFTFNDNGVQVQASLQYIMDR